jgi:2-polyprenylphenol 6-hydroxylase
MSVDVLVSGGGMVGSALACTLGMRGVRTAIIEARRPKPFYTPDDFDIRVSAISPGSESILQELGVWPRMDRNRLCMYREMHVWDASGAGEIHFDCVDVGEPCLGHIIENRVIRKALFEQINELDNVSWHCPDSIQDFDVVTNHVAVKLKSGLQINTRLLVGAEGSTSRVRTLSGIKFNVRGYKQEAVVANVTTENPHENTAWQRFLPTGPLAFLPLANGQCSIVWSTTPAHADQLLHQTDAEFCESLSRALNFRLGQIKSTSTRLSFPLRGGQAEPYVQPRIALIGDAAHIIHPLAGQGVNLGIKDAATLGEILLNTHRDIGSLRVLRQYERSRKADNVAMMHAMEGLNTLFGSSLQPVIWLRNTGLGLTNALAPIKHRLMRVAMGIGAQRPPLI